MTQATTHPDPETLQAFALGQIAPDRLGPVADHVAGCAACAAALAGVPDDTLLGKLRDSPTLGPAAGDTLGGFGDGVPAELTGHPRYVVVRKLGAGGMGTVFQAVHRLMERDVALKVISPRLTRHPVAVQRFAQEVKAAARLAHPNIVAAHDAEQSGGLFFLVMEYVEGVSLDRLVGKKGRLPAEQAVRFIRQAALGLQHAHEQGMVHRDVKPHNLMVTRKGLVKVLDFGLARVAEEAARPADGRPLTALGTVLGTPDYIAPEQVGDSHRVDIRADIYSLGCTLYFLLAGRPPFPDGSALDKALSHVDKPPVPLGTLRPDVPAELLAVLDRMMAKRPADRFQTPGEAAQALAAVQRPAADTVPLDLPAPPPPPKKKRRKAAARRSPLWLGAALAGVAVAAVLFGAVLFGLAKRPTPAGRLPRVLMVLPHREFWPPDYEGVRDALAGRADLVVASSELSPATPEGGGAGVQPALTLDQAREADHDAVVFSGGRHGMEYAFRPPFKDHAREFLGRMLAKGKVVGGLCIGSAVLGNAGVLSGKRATGFPTVRQELERAGATYVDQPVVVDGPVVTGRNDAAAGEFADRLLEQIRRGGR
ncbi:MAG: protein kinase domain-containing protein [Gemmataceae bacterium]